MVRLQAVTNVIPAMGHTMLLAGHSRIEAASDERASDLDLARGLHELSNMAARCKNQLAARCANAAEHKPRVVGFDRLQVRSGVSVRPASRKNNAPTS